MLAIIDLVGLNPLYSLLFSVEKTETAVGWLVFLQLSRYKYGIQLLNNNLLVACISRLSIDSQYKINLLPNFPLLPLRLIIGLILLQPRLNFRFFCIFIIFLTILCIVGFRILKKKVSPLSLAKSSSGKPFSQIVDSIIFIILDFVSHGLTLLPLRVGFIHIKNIVHLSLQILYSKPNATYDR